MPGIKGLRETSFLDWPRRMCAVLFLGGCNFRCPFCHNHALVLSPDALPTLDIEDVCRRLRPLAGWLGGICVTGGEPTLDPGLPDLLRRLRREGWQLKLDTNGTRPLVLEGLLSEGLLDMVAMDVKAPLDQEKYDRCVGVRVDIEAVRASINLIKASGVEYQFRMTVLPRLHTPEDVRDWANELGRGKRLTLQDFNPRVTLDPGLAYDQGYPPEAFQKLRAMVV